MLKQHELLQPIHWGSLTKRMAIGAGIALVLICIFLAGVQHPNPEWPTFWYIRPLIIVPLAGAAGGACYYFIDRLRSQGGWQKIVTGIVSLLVYVIGLWLGTILGLAGTLWD
jgi:hypothetical protein